MAIGKKYEQFNIKLEEGNYNESIKGNYIQGDCYYITIEQEKILDQKPEKEFIRVGKTTSTLEYNSNLIHFVIDFFDCQSEKQIGIVLDILFGEIEEKYIYKNFGLIEKEGYIRFGIKFGTLKLKFSDRCMPAKQRKLPETERIEGKVSCVGSDDNPEWQFKATDTSGTKDRESVLFGSLPDQELGIVNVLKIPFKVEATFQVNINGNGLGITAQDGVWDDKTNKKAKESKLRSFFKKVVEPKLRKNVSTIRLQYD